MDALQRLMRWRAFLLERKHVMTDENEIYDDELDIDDENEEGTESTESQEVFDESLKVIAEADTIQANENGSTVAEVLGLQKLSKYNRMTHNSIERYDIDVEIYEDIVDQSKVIQETLEKGEKVIKTFKYLQQDLFLSLYKYNAIMVDETKVFPSVRMNRIFLEKIFNTQEFMELRKNCRLDVYNAAIGAEILGQKALEMVEEMVDKMKKDDELKEELENIDQLLETEEAMDALLDENDSIDQMIEEMKNSGMSGDELQQAMAEAQAQLDANGMSIEQGKAITNRLAQQCDTLINGGEDQMIAENAQKMVTQIPDITNDIHEVSKMVHAWGLGAGGNSKVPFETKKKAIAKLRNNSKLMKLTDLIGKMKDTAVTEQKKKSKHGAVEIKSVTIGDKIEDTLPSERMNMCNDVTKRDFMRRMTEHSLLTYQKESTKNKNKGPIIVCVDTSGSMSGTRECWSKALAISVLEIAQMQKRDFACILYSSYASKPIVINKNEISPDKIIKVAEDFDGGGTNFEAPLEEALKLIEDATFKEADILFISDGDCYISDSFKKKFKQKKEDKEFKCKGVLINAGGSTSDTSLKEFCDDVTFIDKLADMTDAESDTNKKIFNAF